MAGLGWRVGGPDLIVLQGRPGPPTRILFERPRHNLTLCERHYGIVTRRARVVSFECRCKSWRRLSEAKYRA
jgi:hypothetical protein